jgi:hypothetical protein
VKALLVFGVFAVMMVVVSLAAATIICSASLSCISVVRCISKFLILLYLKQGCLFFVINITIQFRALELPQFFHKKPFKFRYIIF